MKRRRRKRSGRGGMERIYTPDRAVATQLWLISVLKSPALPILQKEAGI
jgi:hypothetical protein